VPREKDGEKMGAITNSMEVEICVPPSTVEERHIEITLWVRVNSVNCIIECFLSE
jgi:hypothetical protein